MTQIHYDFLALLGPKQQAMQLEIEAFHLQVVASFGTHTQR